MRRELFGDEHREVATNMGDIGQLLLNRGDVARAEALLRQSYEISRRVLGANHPNVAAAQSNLGLAIGDRDDFATAEQLFREALAVDRKVMGPYNSGVANKLNNLAWVLREQGKYDEAVVALEEAIAVAERREDKTWAAHFRGNLARVYLAKGDAATAEPLLRQSLAVRLRAFGENDWRVGMTESLLGSALTSLKRFDEAEPLLVRAQRILKDVPGPQGREARATVTRLRALYEAWGRPDKAAVLVATAVKTP